GLGGDPIMSTSVAHFEREREPHSRPPESVARRRRILVSLTGQRPPREAIALGRLVSAALTTPLHGVFVWPTPLAPGDVPRLLGVAPEELEGMVLEVAVGEPGERLAAIAREHPVAFFVLPAADCGLDPCGLGEAAARVLMEADACVIVVRPG